MQAQLYETAGIGLFDKFPAIVEGQIKTEICRLNIQIVPTACISYSAISFRLICREKTCIPVAKQIKPIANFAKVLILKTYMLI